MAIAIREPIKKHRVKLEEVKAIYDMSSVNVIDKKIRTIRYPDKDGKKRCSVCKEYKTFDNYIKARSKYSTYFSYCRLCTRWRQRSKNLLSKLEFILAYGGKCQCCGEKGIDFLTVEHIEGDRKNNDGYRDACLGGGLIANLKVRGWPKDYYTVLCFNCNCCKKFGRPCAHKTKEYSSYMSKVFSYMSGEHKARYDKLLIKLNKVE